MIEHSPEVKRICAEAYLKHVRSLAVKVRNLENDIAEQREQLDGITAIQYREQVTQTQQTDKFEQAVIKLQELIADYCTELAGYVDEQKTAHEVLRKLERPEHQCALKAYYVKAKSWEQVCVDMGYSWGGMMKLRASAIVDVYDVMPEEWRRQVIPNAMVV